jgi:hypothetical protein
VKFYVLVIWPHKTNTFLLFPSMGSTKCSSHMWIYKFMNLKNYRPKNYVEFINLYVYLLVFHPHS